MFTRAVTKAALLTTALAPRAWGVSLELGTGMCREQPGFASPAQVGQEGAQEPRIDREELESWALACDLIRFLSFFKKKSQRGF